MKVQSLHLNMKKGESIGVFFRAIRELSSTSSFIILVIFTVSNIVPTVYIQSQFDSSPTMIAYKEIAEDCYPYALCDEEGRIHLAWQSDRRGNWDIYYTLLDDHIQKREFDILTTGSRDGLSKDDLFPSLAEDEKGDIWVIWVRTESGKSSIWYRTLDSQTSTWNKERRITADDYEKKSPILMSVDSNKMLVAWISEEENIQKIKYSILQDNSLIEIKELHDVINVRKITLGKTEDGKIFAVWNSMSFGKNCLFFSIFDEYEKDFTIPQPLGEPFDGYDPSIVIRKDEPSLLFFCDEYSDIFFSVESPDGVSDVPSFSNPQPICKSGALEDCPIAIETAEGEVYLFWASTYTGDNEIFFCHSFCVDIFQKGIDYPSDSESSGKGEHFVKNLTRDPSQYNPNTDGYFCDDIFFSTAIVKGELWLVWDSYSWDPSAENGNVRKIKLMKFSDGHHWEKPCILMDNSISEYDRRDDRCPALVETADGYIWLFWYTDRYEGTYDICYIKFRLTDNNEPPHILNELPERLTDSPKNDLHPAAVSIGDTIYVVWQSDRNGNWDIFLKQIDGEKRENVLITDQKTPESRPSIAAYRDWHLETLFHSEHLIVSWDSLEKDKFSVYFADLAEDGMIQLQTPENTINLPTSKLLSVQSPDIYYVSRHNLIRRIFQKNLWLVWQSSEIATSVTNIQCSKDASRNGGIEETQITDNLSRNASPEVVEFDGKTWIFWDSNGGGNGRGIYYKYLYRKSIPVRLWASSFCVVALWVLFLLDVRSKGGIKRFVSQFCGWVDEWFKNHIWYGSVIIGVITGLITYVILQFLGRLL